MSWRAAWIFFFFFSACWETISVCQSACTRSSLLLVFKGFFNSSQCRNGWSPKIALSNYTECRFGIKIKIQEQMTVSRDRGFACLLVCVCSTRFAAEGKRAELIRFHSEAETCSSYCTGCRKCPGPRFLFLFFFPFPYLPVPKHGKNRALHSLLSSALFRLSFNVYLLPRCCWIIVELSRIMTLVSSALSSVSRVLSNRVHGFDYGHNAALGLGGGWLFFFFPYLLILLSSYSSPLHLLRWWFCREEVLSDWRSCRLNFNSRGCQLW